MLCLPSSGQRFLCGHFCYGFDRIFKSLFDRRVCVQNEWDVTAIPEQEDDHLGGCVMGLGASHGDGSRKPDLSLQRGKDLWSVDHIHPTKHTYGSKPSLSIILKGDRKH